MKNFILLLRTDNHIIKILGQFRTKQLASWFVRDNLPEFNKDVCQWSKFNSPEFITIEK